MKIAGKSSVRRELRLGSKRVNVDLVCVEGKQVVSLIGGKLDGELHYDVKSLRVKVLTDFLIGSLAGLVDKLGELLDKSLLCIILAAYVKLDLLISPVESRGCIGLDVIYLIHIGVNGGAPSCSPYGKVACGELLKSIGIGGNVYLEADLVEELACVPHSLPSGMVGLLACNGEGVLKSMVALYVYTVSIKSIACALYKRDDERLLLLLCKGIAPHSCQGR